MDETATQLTRAGSTVGTAAYMSPEQAGGGVADARSDLWSQGIFAYEMLAGRAPFPGTNALAIIQAVLTAPIAPIRTLRPDVAPELEEIVSRTLMRDRDRRPITPSNVRDLASACHARLASSGQQPAIVRPRTSRRTRVATAVVALVVAVSGIAWWAQRSAKVRWARQEALPEIVRLAEAERFDEAYHLAQQAQRYIPDDPLLGAQIKKISDSATVKSEPPGADVFYRPYGRSSEPWRPFGKTPIVNATCRPSLRSRASHTSPIPPRPKGATISNASSRDPTPTGIRLREYSPAPELIRRIYDGGGIDNFVDPIRKQSVAFRSQSSLSRAELTSNTILRAGAGTERASRVGETVPSVTLSTPRMTTHRVLNRHTRATEDDDRSPFPSLESAQEYIGLLASAVADAQRDIQEDVDAAGKEDAARRVEALHLVNYKLSQLQNHVGATGRLLNDLRMLRRLLLNERRLKSVD
jgi:serine/threonine protein kinase